MGCVQAILVTSAVLLGGCGGSPPGRCLSPPRLYDGTCVVRGAEVVEGLSVVSLELEGPVQPPFAISARRPADQLDALQGLVGQRFHCRVTDHGPCPSETVVDLTVPAPAP